MDNTASKYDHHPMDIEYANRSRMKFRSCSVNDKCFDFLLRVLKKDSELQNHKLQIKELNDQLHSIKLKLDLTFNVTKKSISVRPNSFATIINEPDVAKKNILKNNMYAFFIIRILHLKLIDYQNLLKRNRKETTRKCKEFLSKILKHHIIETYIIDRRNGIQAFSNQLIQMQRCLEVLPNKGDCTIWKECVQSFDNEIVRYHTDISFSIHS